ncbi:MAG TPA: carboxypeptidase regulatory-like domain-containing protein [Nannocystaceae bacterium]|nr:carboxypeptidase regulatory-like domain-containing protein [Nannocystaceae bacterium]
MTASATREDNGRVGWQEGTGSTDREGKFVLELDPGSWTLRAGIDTAKSEPATVHVAVGERSTIDLVVDARRGTMRGRVVDSEGSPVADAVVAVQAIDDAARGRQVLDGLRESAELVRGRLALTDDDGRFRIELRAGPHVVLARRRGGGEAWKLGVAIGEDVKLVIPEESAIAGTVRAPDGSAPARVSVRIAAAELGLRREESFVLGRGRFRFEGLPAGSYVVTARAAEGEGRVDVTLAAGDAREGLAIALSPGAPRSGRFVDLDTGAPIEGIFAAAGTADDAAQDLAVRAQIAVETGDARAKSDADGRFTVGAVVGDVVRVVAVPADFAGSPYGPAIAEVPATDTLPDVPLARLRLGRDAAPGTFGLELATSRGEICNRTVSVAGVSGPAAAAGVRAGDAIVAIDGHDVADWRCYLVTPLLLVAPDTKVSLTLARGDTVDVVAATRTE